MQDVLNQLAMYTLLFNSVIAIAYSRVLLFTEGTATLYNQIFIKFIYYL